MKLTAADKRKRSKRVLATLRFLNLESQFPAHILHYIKRRAGETTP